MFIAIETLLLGFPYPDICLSHGCSHLLAIFQHSEFDCSVLQPFTSPLRHVRENFEDSRQTFPSL